MFVPTKYLLRQLLGFVSSTQAGAGESVLYGAKMGLYKASVEPGPDLAYADLTLADFDGYALSAGLVWTAVFDDLADLVTVSGGVKHWAMSGAVTPNNIYGHFLVTGAGNNLLGVEAYGTSIPMTDAFSAFDVDMRVTFDHRVGYGASLVG